jgi:hypothetical protein
MDKQVFYIPTLPRYWLGEKTDRVPTREETNWAELEAKRALAMVQKLFPDTSFELVKSPPPRQTYPPRSPSAEIREFLESRTRLRFGD